METAADVTMLELIVIHVPKTAGNSLRSVLHGIYGRDAVALIGTDTSKLRGQILLDDLPVGSRVVTGHICAGQVKKLRAETGAKLITFLRDPISRYLSQYLHLKRNKVANLSCANQLHSLIPFWLYTLNPRHHNVMSKYLANIPVDGYDLIGITENFSQSMQQLSEIMNWPRLSTKDFEARKNVNAEYGHASVKLSRQIRWIITKLNRSDQLLYEAAVRRFQESRRPLQELSRV